jgi:hypothetical protein
LRGERTSARSGTDEPHQRDQRISRNTSAEVIRGTQHGLAVGVTTGGTALPPQDGLRGIAVNA